MSEPNDWEARARELLRKTDRFISPDIEAASLQLGREMADERERLVMSEFAHLSINSEKAKREAADARAEEIAREIALRVPDGTIAPYNSRECGLIEAKAIARSFITKPKTREQVLEEALRSISALIPDARPTAQRALEWKP